MAKAKYRYEYQMATDIHRSKRLQGMFLKWVNSRPEFKKRRPTVEETMHEMTKGCLKDLVEQDIKKAANNYWRQEAQYYLRHIQVIKIDLVTKSVSPPVKAFLPLGVRGEGGAIPDSSYIPSKRVANDPVMVDYALERARREFDHWVERYQDYAEFFDAFRPVIEAYQQIKKDLDVRILAIRKKTG